MARLAFARVAIVAFVLVTAGVGCSSSAPRIDAPALASGSGTGSGPTKVQYGNSSPTPNGAAPTAATPGTPAPANDSSYRNTSTPALERMTMTSSQQRAMSQLRPDVNLFENYNSNLPWSTRSSAPGLRTLPSSGGFDRGRR